MQNKVHYLKTQKKRFFAQRCKEALIPEKELLYLPKVKEICPIIAPSEKKSAL